MKVSSLLNLNRETTSFPNFFTLFQDPADHHHDDNTALQIHEHSCDTEASETSPFKANLSPSFSFDETNEIGFLAGTSSVRVFRSESEHNDRTPPNSVSVGSNQFGGSEWSNLLASSDFSPSYSFDEFGFLAGTSSVGVFRSESEHNDRTQTPPSQVSKAKEKVGEEVCVSINNLQTYIDNHSGSGVQSLESRTLQLEFLDKLSQPVRTRQMIEGEGNTPFRVALVDVTTKQFVTSGPEASAEVEIVAVKGDFDGDNWTVEEFNKKIVREMEGKKSLLTGNVHLNLEAGVGVVSNISFMHNSHWMRVCKLRLGAKVVDSFNGARVREAVTEPFVLKDYREIYSNKPSVPSLNDEVWRLKKINRDGPLHNRLVRENIKTVKDFLTRFFIDPQSLRNIIGNAKILEAAVDHAKKCVLDKRLHLSFPIDSEKKSGVVFNDVGGVVGLISECCYFPLDMLSKDQKADAEKLVLSALEPTKQVKSFDDEICMHSYLQSLNDAYPSNSPRLESAGHYSCEASQTHYGHDHTQPIKPFFPRQSSSTFPLTRFPSTDSLGLWSSVPSFGNASHMNEYGCQSINAEDLINEGPLFSPENLLNPSICYPESTSLQLVDMDHSFQYQYSSSIVNGFLSTRAAAAHIARRRWSRAIATVLYLRKIIATFKLVSSEAVLASKRPRIY